MTFLSRLLRKERDPHAEVRVLWQRTVALARAREFYAECGVADTVAGRFDMVCAVLALVLVRMERTPALAQQAVRLTELFVADMDGQLRELGIGDVVVGKHVGRLMGALSGRLGAYRAALGAGEAALAEAAARNVTLEGGGSAACVAAKLRVLAARLDASADDALLAGEIAP